MRWPYVPHCGYAFTPDFTPVKRENREKIEKEYTKKFDIRTIPGSVPWKTPSRCLNWPSCAGI